MMEQAQLQARNQHAQNQQVIAQQRASVGGGMSPNGGQFPNQSAPSASHQHQSQILPQNPQNGMFSPLANPGQGGVNVDPRNAAHNANQSGMNLTPHQRQFVLQQQQQQQLMRAVNGYMSSSGMNPQQVAIAQERMRQEQQQRLAQRAGSPAHVSSPASADSNHFPVLRSNTIPGIARSTRSPSDGAPSPMTPRAPTRGPSMGHEDYQRMMQAQQQQQGAAAAALSMGGQNTFNPQSQNWQQQQQHQQQQQQLSQAMQLNHAYGMSPQMTFGGTPPPNASQNWGQPQHYPFSPSPGAQHPSDRPQSASSTPAQVPLQMQTDQVDFDLFNWPAQ